MSTRRDGRPTASGVPCEGVPPQAGGQAGHYESGIVRKEDVEPGGAPPWEVVLAYLCRGEHKERVEGHAAKSRAFAEVLAALRNDREERAEQRSKRAPGA